MLRYKKYVGTDMQVLHLSIEMFATDGGNINLSYNVKSDCYWEEMSVLLDIFYHKLKYMQIQQAWGNTAINRVVNK